MSFKKNGKQTASDIGTGNELTDLIIVESKRINKLSTFRLREELQHLGLWTRGMKPIFTRRLKAFYSRNLINYFSTFDLNSEPIIIRDKAGKPYDRCLVNSIAKQQHPSPSSLRGPPAVLDYSRQQHAFEYVVVIDFEATCFAKHAAPRGFQHEIIEFPAVLLHLHTSEPTPTVVDTFHMYCTPVKYPRLDKYCVELTHITQSTVTSSLVIAEDDNGRVYVHDATDDLTETPAKLHHPLSDVYSPRLVSEEEGEHDSENDERTRRRHVHAAIFPIVLERFERWLANHNLLPADAVFSAVEWFREQQSASSSLNSNSSSASSLAATLTELDLSRDANTEPQAEEELDEHSSDAVVEREEQQADGSDEEDASGTNDTTDTLRASPEQIPDQSFEEEEEAAADGEDAQVVELRATALALGMRAQFRDEHPRRFVIATHGSADAAQFLRVQCAQSRLAFPEWGAAWIDLKRLYQAFYCDHKASTIPELLAHLGMTLTGRLHSGLGTIVLYSPLLMYNFCI